MNRWDRHIRFSRVPIDWFGVTNWQIGSDNRPWRYWIQFSLLTANIQIRAHVAFIVWSFIMLACGAQIARWIG